MVRGFSPFLGWAAGDKVYLQTNGLMLLLAGRAERPQRSHAVVPDASLTTARAQRRCPARSSGSARRIRRRRGSVVMVWPVITSVRALPDDGEFGHPAVEPVVAPGQLAERHGGSQPGQPPQQGTDRHLELQAAERRTQAEVRTEAEP